MAALLAEPGFVVPLFPSSAAYRRNLSLPEGNLGFRLKPFPLSIVSPLVPSPCPCSAGTLDPEPAEESPASYSRTKVGSKEGGRERRRAVRIAWEKLVRWSRSWRSKAKSDVLERTKKVVVLGGGSFGTAMAAHVASKKAEMEVAMLVRDVDVCRAINETRFNRKISNFPT